jgi:uncharacterized phage infection (PIP) family protein YhgE
MKVWPGDVLDFLREKKAESIALFEKNKSVVQAQKASVAEVKSAPVESKEDTREKEKNKKKLQAAIQKFEKEIETIESEIKSMDDVIAAIDYSKQDDAKEKIDKYAALKSKLDSVMEQWETAGAELSSLD